MQKSILVVAGFDPSANAGLLRDGEVCQKLGVKYKVVMTSVASQNEKKFIANAPVSDTDLKNQLKSVSPLGQFSAVKLGMLASLGTIKKLDRFFSSSKIKLPVICDPVLVSTTGGLLLPKEAWPFFLKFIQKHVTLLTPNWPEALMLAQMLGEKITKPDRGAIALLLVQKLGVSVYLKGGHFKTDNKKVEDLFISEDLKTIRQISHPRLKKSFRGTGCRLSTAMACEAAVQKDILKACLKASHFLNSQLKQESSLS